MFYLSNSRTHLQSSSVNVMKHGQHIGVVPAVVGLYTPTQPVENTDPGDKIKTAGLESCLWCLLSLFQKRPKKTQICKSSHSINRVTGWRWLSSQSFSLNEGDHVSKFFIMENFMEKDVYHFQAWSSKSHKFLLPSSLLSFSGYTCGQNLAPALCPVCHPVYIIGKKLLYCVCDAAQFWVYLLECVAFNMWLG